MQSLAPDQVVYAGTASKSLAPGLRLAWLVVPDHLLEELVEVQRIRGGPPSNVDQLTLAEFIGSAPSTGTYAEPASPTGDGATV